jgi:hypothetical protein
MGIAMLKEIGSTISKRDGVLPIFALLKILSGIQSII